MTERAPPSTRRRGGLFARILLTFIATTLTSALLAGVGGFMFATRVSSAWAFDARTALDESAEQLRAAMADDDALEALITTLEQQLDSPVGVYTRRGRRIAGHGPGRLPHRVDRRALRNGTAVVNRPPGRFAPPMVVLALARPEGPNAPAVVAVTPRPGFRFTMPLIMIGLMLPVLGVGAWMLSRSLTRRLARLEAGANRIASGDLEHRITFDASPSPDELEHLARAFNDMAGKVEGLISGQRTLLANVSHELRTPIARMKVLVEILSERAAALRAKGETSRPLDRIDKGLADLGIDITEVETLISDLLTSGRLELRHGNASALVTQAVDVEALLHRVARKVDATVDIDEPVALVADELLVERLLSNLLANARRACPEGAITISASVDQHTVEFVVQDEGPGVAPEHRESIFEPFTRLDSARDRDRGGVGLGLYLCRQICRSHGGDIAVVDRPDGRSGARFVVRVPEGEQSPANA